MGKKYKITPASFLNDVTFIQIYNQLKELAINTCQWNNLPPSVDERFLELTLFESGMALYFDDEVLGNLTLKAVVNGAFNEYGIPKLRRGVGYNSSNFPRTIDNSVIIYNNYLHTPTDVAIKQFASRLYEIQRTIDINVIAQKTPVFISCSQQEQLTMENIFSKYAGNEPLIIGDNKWDSSALKVIELKAPFVADKLQILKRQVWNEALTFLGIENSNTEKRERLVTDEITTNLGGVEAQRFCRLNPRRQAAKQINEMFGTDITVNFREEFIRREEQKFE